MKTNPISNLITSITSVPWAGINDGPETAPGHLYTLSHTLSRWHIPDTAYTVAYEHLDRVPVPFIACFNNQQYGVITRINKEFVAVYDNYLDNRMLSITDFEKQWSGTVLLSKKDVLTGMIAVSMPVFSEIKLAGIINVYTKMMFVAACHQFTVQEFERELFNYMLGPLPDQNFVKFIREYKAKLKSKNDEFFKDYFFIKEDTKNKYTRIDLPDIYYIEGHANYIMIHTKSGHKITYLTLHEMENRLPVTHFTRINKSVIVADDKIKTINGNTLVLDGSEQQHDIGRVYKQAFFEKFEKNFAVTGRGR